MQLKTTLASLTMLFGLVSVVAVEASPQKIVGEYIEARTCDVWTGPCFANSEINLTGENAVMGWAIRSGSWNGVLLDGLKVAATVDADGTLGTKQEGNVRAVVYIDGKATPDQGRALIDMARTLAPRYLQNIVRVHTGQPIAFSRAGSNVTFKVGSEVELRTMALSMHCDIICGNEEQAYPTLATTLSSHCAKTLAHRYSGKDLGCRWSDPGARSAMIGTFSLPDARLADASN